MSDTTRALIALGLILFAATVAGSLDYADAVLYAIDCAR